MSKTIVVNMKHEDYDVQCDRKTKWGNPFSHRSGTAARWRADTREQAIAKHALWILQQPRLLGALWELRGKRLGCHCKPRACHCDTLAALADSPLGLTQPVVAEQMRMQVSETLAEGFGMLLSKAEGGNHDEEPDDEAIALLAITGSLATIGMGIWDELHQLNKNIGKRRRATRS